MVRVCGSVSGTKRALSNGPLQQTLFSSAPLQDDSGSNLGKVVVRLSRKDRQTDSALTGSGVRQTGVALWERENVGNILKRFAQLQPDLVERRNATVSSGARRGIWQSPTAIQHHCTVY